MRCLVYFNLVIFFTNCSSTNYNQNYKNSEIVCYNLIKTCVEKSFETFPEVNTKNYVLNLSTITSLNKKGVDSFLNYKNSILPTTHDDSVMIFENKDWSRFHMSKSMIIQISSIDSINEKSILVKFLKVKSTDETIKMEAILLRNLDTYEISFFKMTK